MKQKYLDCRKREIWTVLLFLDFIYMKKETAQNSFPKSEATITPGTDRIPIIPEICLRCAHPMDMHGLLFTMTVWSFMML